MKITKSQLKQIIKEELSAMIEKFDDEAFEKNQADARKYRKKGKWVLKKTGADDYVKPGGTDADPKWTKDKDNEARVFKDELTAEVHKKAIEEKGLAVTIENISDESEGKEKAK
jgi:hypothetical protein